MNLLQFLVCVSVLPVQSLIFILELLLFCNEVADQVRRSDAILEITMNNDIFRSPALSSLNS